MLDINTLGEFSRTNCGLICAFLVPASFVGAVISLYNLYKGRSQRQITSLAISSSIFPVLLLLHVATWWLIGVVMLPTFILLGLGSSCIAVQLLAVTKREKVQNLLQTGVGFAYNWLNQT
ncbi:MAG: hypothetical protein N5P05_002335 [Chroococcopsis gigantea SAG 12.99]|jgi:hypothetical protein|nr:hypothetical protein [Chlorogloea purpurea SAG 13.99]MDV3000729.1 hypothetical protein [Chroococcopsis gigantea SAG 12.99]